MVYDQSVPVRVNVEGTSIHNQLGHRTVAQVNVHVRRSGQLTSIELRESHCSDLCYVYRHGHDHGCWSTELALRWGFGLRHLCFAWIFISLLSSKAMVMLSQFAHNTISHHLDYASQVARANAMWRNHQSSLESRAADTVSTSKTQPERALQNARPRCLMTQSPLKSTSATAPRQHRSRRLGSVLPR